MSTEFLSANESLIGYNGTETIYKRDLMKLHYTIGVKTIAQDYHSYWFLDIIESYQKKLKNEDFQVWKLERDLVFLVVDGIKKVTERKDSFIVVCEDGNENILIQQKIPFSDFPFDFYNVWIQNNIIYLPSEN